MSDAQKLGDMVAAHLQGISMGMKCERHSDRDGVERVRTARGLVWLCGECLEGYRKAMKDHEAAQGRARREGLVVPLVAERCGNRYVDATLENLEGLPQKFMDRLREVRDLVTSGLFYGPTGTGKTHAGVGIFRRWFVEYGAVEFWPVGELMDHLRDEAREKATLTGAVKRLRGLRGLILDDMGGDRVTDFAAEGLLRVLDWRSRDGSATIITTNLDEAPLREAIGDRAVSRVFGLVGRNIFKFGGKDRRTA